MSQLTHDGRMTPKNPTGFVDKNNQNNELQKPSSTIQSLEEIIHMANKVGMAYVQARLQAEKLDLLKPTERARAMERYDDGKRSEAKIRRLAEIDSNYVAFVNQLAEARAEAEKLRIRYESYKNLFEARRSILSFKKAEMSLL